jgi:hypothetical protein
MKYKKNQRLLKKPQQMRELRKRVKKEEIDLI